MVTFSEGVQLYLLDAEDILSPLTVEGYKRTFKKFQSWAEEDFLIDDIEKSHISQFLRFWKGQVSEKTRLNYHTGLAALWTWFVNEGLVDNHVVRATTAPKPVKKVVHPMTEDDIKALFANINKTKGYYSQKGEIISHTPPNVDRNRAILLMLLDTGVRASELCNMKIRDVDLSNKRVKIMGKGSKERIVPFSGKTAKKLGLYLIKRKREEGGKLNKDDPTFPSSRRLGNRHRPMTSNGLRLFLVKLGKRAGVENVHPHRFRHTFAIQWLRNGGDVFTLQAMLGHSDLSMVKRYVDIAQTDVARVHRSASAVANWNIG